MRLQGIGLGASVEVAARLGLVAEGDRSSVGGVVLDWTGRGGGLLGLDLLDAPGADVLPVHRTGPAHAADHEHPLGAVAVDHVVVLTGDVGGTVDRLGVPARRTEQRDGRDYAYVVAETALLEVVGPTTADDRPPRLWGLALAVHDLDAAVGLLGEACGPARPAHQPGRRIATVRHEQLGLGVPVVLLSARPTAT